MKLQQKLQALQNRLNRYISGALKGSKVMIVNLIIKIARLENQIEICHAHYEEKKEPLQYQYLLSNGKWVDTDDAHAQRLIEKAVKIFDNRYDSINDVIELLNSGKELYYDYGWDCQIRLKRSEKTTIINYPQTMITSLGTEVKIDNWDKFEENL